MTTTFEKFAGQQAPNYCSNPKLDVEILPDERHCSTCGGRVVLAGDRSGRWEHAEQVQDDHRVEPRVRCRYCNSEEHATFAFEAYADVTRCTRCGGVDGFAIGD